jgi:hypothetical protein
LRENPRLIGRHGLVEREQNSPSGNPKSERDWRNWVREVRGIEREDREEPITNSNRLIEREVGGLGEKLGAGEKRERREQGEIFGGQGQGKEREEREGNRPRGSGESDWERRERGGSSSQGSGDSSPWRSPLKDVALQPALSA